MAALLRDVGGGKVDGQAFGRQRNAERVERRPHAFLGFRDGFVGQTDDGEGRQTVADLHLHIDLLYLDAVKGHCVNAGEHYAAAQSSLGQR